MSEFLAEAAVLVRANTAAFRTQLLAEVESAVAAASKLAVIPVTPVVSAGAAKKSAAESLAASQIISRGAGISAGSLEREAAERRKQIEGLKESGDQIAKNAAEQQRLSAAENESARSVRRSSIRRSEALKGIQAQTLSFAGLRGAIIGANPAFLAATASVILFGKAIQSATAFATQLNVFQATAGATADQMERVGAAAKQLGQDVTLPAVTTASAAEAMTELSKAGLSVQDSIDGARGVLQLATAAAIDNATATEIAASALNAFGLAGTEATHVADVLANAANSSQGSIADIGIAMRQASAVARQAGLSFEQTAAVLTIFARSGLRGSDAGTSFRTMLIRLINPTAKAQEVIDKLGLSLRTSTGAINLGIFDQFAAATKNFTNAQRDQAAAVIFGSDAIRGFLIGVRAGNVELNKQIGVNNRAGAAADLAAARTKGLAGAMENLKNQLSNLGLELGTTLIPALGDVVGAISTVIDTARTLEREAAKPINLVVNITGKDKTEGGFFSKLFGIGPGAIPAQVHDAANRARRLKEDLKQTAAAFTEDTGFDVASFTTVKQAREEIPQLVSELNKAKGSPSVFNEVVKRLEAMRDSMAKGIPETKQFSKSLDVFIGQLQTLSTRTDIKVPITLPPEVLSGTLAADTATKNAATFGATFLPSMEEIGKQAAQAVSKGLVDPGAKAAIAAAAREAAQAANQAAAAASAELDVQFRGGTDAQRRAALVRERAAQEKQVAALQRKGAPQKDIDAAKQAAIATQQKIDAIDEAAKQAAQQAVDKRKAAAQEIASAREKADQDFLNAITGGRTGFTDAIARAEGTPGLQDNIKAQQALIARLVAERDRISQTVKNIKTKISEMAARTTQLITERQTLKRLRQEQADNLQQIVQDKFELRVTGAEAFGNIQLLTKLFDQRISALKKAIEKAREEGKATKTLADTLKQVRADREQALSDTEEKRIHLAELQGNESLELKLINRRIARLQKAIAAAKKEHRATLDLELALAETRNQRDEILNKAKDDVKGQATTAFDLLKQFTDVFNQNAGNLIGANQPFAGPTGFTADIAQFLVRRPGVQQTTATAAAAKTPIELNDDRLVRSMDRLADVIERSGNRSSGVGTTVTRTGHGLGRQFVDSNQVRQSIEARSGI